MLHFSRRTPSFTSPHGQSNMYGFSRPSSRPFQLYAVACLPLFVCVMRDMSMDPYAIEATHAPTELSLLAGA